MNASKASEHPPDKGKPMVVGWGQQYNDVGEKPTVKSVHLILLIAMKEHQTKQG